MDKEFETDSDPVSKETLTQRTLGVSWTSITRSEQHLHRLHDERKIMTQTSPSRTARGLQRPALALALGTAAAATVLAPVASMAATAPTYNDVLANGSAKPTGTLLAPAKIGGATAALQTKRTTALPATAFPTPVTGTIYGDVASQALASSAGTQKTALTSAYAAWKTAATPVVNAWIAYTKAKTPAAKATALKAYNAKLAIYNKKAAGALNNGPAKWTAYSTKYNAWIAVYNSRLTTVKSNHFKLAARTAFAVDCTSADNRHASDLGGKTQGHNVGDAPAVDQWAGWALYCDPATHILSYYLEHKLDSSGPGGWETFKEKITTNPATGAITHLDFTTDAVLGGTSLESYIKAFVQTPVTTWLTQHPFTATTKADFSKFVTKALNDSGAATTDGNPNIGGTNTCISVASGATLTCQAFTESLQAALNASVKGMPY
jgi:hypothetical protein